MSHPQGRKPLVWAAGTREELSTFPDEVKNVLGYALHQAQIGRKHPNAKPLKGFGGAGVLEIVADHSGGTYRGVYTVKFEGRVYVLHVFQKKSKHGIAMPRKESTLVIERLKRAEKDYENWQKGQG